MTERQVTDKILQWFANLDGAKAIKVHGGAYQGEGTPDIAACVMGRSVWVEVKQPGEKPRPIQSYELAAWRKAGAIALVVTSLEELVDALERAFDEHPTPGVTA